MYEEIAKALLLWYKENRRSLPWRDDPSPYHVWVSEIMLQQTRVEAVKEYYRRFMDRFPDIETLAAADEDECRKVWEGLGYYSRVRNMKRAAASIVEEYGGKMPVTSAALKRLPGIGPYTSAAIASIAFGERIPAVDGNLLRVFARLALYEKEIRGREALSAAAAYFQEVMDSMPSEEGVLPKDRYFFAGNTVCACPGDINQALMDLGAMVCIPGSRPLCGQCPLRDHCLAFRNGRCSDIPVMPPKKTRRIEKRTVLIIRDGERIVLRHRPEKGLLAGMYEFPNEDGWLTEEEALEKARQYGFSPVRILPLPEAKHVFTHLEWRMRGYEIRVGDFDEMKKETGRVTDRTKEKSDSCFAVTISQMLKQYAVPNAFDAFFSSEAE